MATTKTNNLANGISESEKVDMFMQQLNHPLIDVVIYLRKCILSIDKNIGEGIFWNAPTFYYTGRMKPFDPKTYKRYILGFNFYKQDCIRLIFLRAADVGFESTLLEGDYKDGRRIIHFKSIAEVKAAEKEFKKIILALLKNIDDKMIVVKPQ